jgi:hypothetical protein
MGGRRWGVGSRRGRAALEEAGGWASDKDELGHFQAIVKIDSVTLPDLIRISAMSIGMSFIWETYGRGLLP